MRWPKLVAAFTQSVEVSASIDAEGVDEDGAPVEDSTWSGKCNWQDSTARTFSRDRTDVAVDAVLYVDGDPFPSMWSVAGGTVTIGEDEREIIRARKNRNPDGSVNNTELWLR